MFIHALKFTIIWTSWTLCCVVKILLSGRAGSLPSYARNLSGLTEVFLAGNWQINKRHQNGGCSLSPLEKGGFSLSPVWRLVCAEWMQGMHDHERSACAHVKKKKEGAQRPTTGYCASLLIGSWNEQWIQFIVCPFSVVCFILRWPCDAFTPLLIFSRSPWHTTCRMWTAWMCLPGWFWKVFNLENGVGVKMIENFFLRESLRRNKLIEKNYKIMKLSNVCKVFVGVKNVRNFFLWESLWEWKPMEK